MLQSVQAPMDIYPGISMNPDVRFGKPCIAGTRIDVATVVGLIAAGETVETVATEYQLSVEQVRAALGYAAHVAAHLPPAVRQASRGYCSTKTSLSPCSAACSRMARRRSTSSRSAGAGCRTREFVNA